MIVSGQNITTLVRCPPSQLANSILSRLYASIYPFYMAHLLSASRSSLYLPISPFSRSTPYVSRLASLCYVLKLTTCLFIQLKQEGTLYGPVVTKPTIGSARPSRNTWKDSQRFTTETSSRLGQKRECPSGPRLELLN